MPYLSSRKQFSKRRALSVACAVLALAFCLSFFPVDIASFLFSPFLEIERIVHRARMSISVVFDTLSSGARSKFGLAAENRVLREQVRVLASVLESMERRTKEDRETLTSLGRDRRIGERVLGAVIAKPGVLPYDLVLIDVGRDVGVTPEALVLAAGDIPIGVVAEATSQAAKVRLFSSFGERRAAFVGASALPVELRGVGGGAFTVELPRSSGILEGSLVYWPGFPVRAMGVVEHMEGDETDPFVTAHVRYLAQPFELRWVEVEIITPDDVRDVFDAESPVGNR